MKRNVALVLSIVGALSLVFTFQNCGDMASQKLSQISSSSQGKGNFGLAPINSSANSEDGSFDVTYGSDTRTITPGTTMFDNKIYYDGNDWRYTSDDSIYPYINDSMTEVVDSNTDTATGPNHGIPPQGLSLGGLSTHPSPDSLGYDGRRTINVGDKALGGKVYWGPGWKYVSNDQPYPREYQQASNTSGTQAGTTNQGTSFVDQAQRHLALAQLPLPQNSQMVLAMGKHLMEFHLVPVAELFTALMPQVKKSPTMLATLL